MLSKPFTSSKPYVAAADEDDDDKEEGNGVVVMVVDMPYRLCRNFPTSQMSSKLSLCMRRRTVSWAAMAVADRTVLYCNAISPVNRVQGEEVL